MIDALGDRMKSNYEDRVRYELPRRSYTIIRVDGKAFHTYTKGLQRPFDDDLISDMNHTAIYLCQNIMGARFAYVQSDEISILLTDFETITTEAWFDGNIQKMVSVAASMATSRFNRLRYIAAAQHTLLPVKDAEFDARVFQIPQQIEVYNYFLWRQRDATKNSISSVAQSLYSHKELMGKDSSDKQEMIFAKGINWNDYDPGKKRGRFIERKTFVNGVMANFKVNMTQEFEDKLEGTVRNKWTVVESPIFSQEPSFLLDRIPNNQADGIHQVV